MAIIQDSILGKDCTLSLTTASFSGTIVNWDNFDVRFRKEQSDFNTATSTLTLHSRTSWKCSTMKK